MCGLVGLVAKRDVAADIYDALTMLQHRGQDAAGIMTCSDGKLMQRKGEGLVRDVFRANHMAQLLGRFGIGHVRYPTQGSSGTALPTTGTSPIQPSCPRNCFSQISGTSTLILILRCCSMSLRMS